MCKILRFGSGISADVNQKPRKYLEYILDLDNLCAAKESVRDLTTGQET